MTAPYTQPDLWEGWADESPPADPLDDDEPQRLAFHRGRFFTVTDLPDIATYQTV
jgi:hypothetical protein